MTKVNTTELFIEKSKLIHGDKYDYSLVEYKGYKTKVKIICREHGIFEQRPHSHTEGRGCVICSDDSKRLSLNEFIKKSINIHGNEYDYSLVEYVSYNINVKIVCKIHGVFKQTPHNHLKKERCPICCGNKKLTTEEFITRSNIIHDSKYDYSLVEYYNNYTKIKIVCKIHGCFEQSPNNHFNGIGCPKCSLIYGKLENKWLDLYNIPKEYRQYKINNFYVDGIDVENKIIYEFYGDFWHGNPNIYKSNDFNKVAHLTFGELYNKTLKREDYLKSLGYNIISIWEEDYKKLTKI